MKKLICFPYAGGSSTIYSDLKRQLGRQVEVVPIDYSGHGMRMFEELPQSLDETADDAYKLVKELSKDDDYILFGYSMGALVAYEVAKRLEQNNDKLPLTIIFVSSNPPGISDVEERIFGYDDDDFLKSVIDLGGMTDEILEDEELKSFFAPILRADFKQIYDYKGSDYKLNQNIVVLYTVDEKHFLGWKGVTNKACKLIPMQGGHFFLHDRVEDLVSVLKTIIATV